MAEAAADKPIAFSDLAAQRERIGDRIDRAMARVVEHGRFILGPEVGELERRLSEFCGAGYAVACANGTDALALGLMAKQVRPGEAVLVPSFTFASTAEVVVWMGATPVFVEVRPDTFNMDADSLECGIRTAKREGLRPVAIIPVDLFGQPADYDAIEPVAETHGLWLMVDAAQSFGAAYRGRTTGQIGDIAITSFFPAKPLGCYGDGGALFTDDAEIAEIVRSLRVHGKGRDKYDNVRIGMNGRLDTLQAAILIEKLAIFADEIDRRNEVAGRYSKALAGVVEVPNVVEGARSTWAQYSVILPRNCDRRAVMEALKQRGIPTAIYYPKPLHRQTAFRGYPVAGRDLPVAEELSKRVLSLPMHPYLDPTEQDRVVAALRAALG